MTNLRQTLLLVFTSGVACASALLSNSVGRGTYLPPSSSHVFHPRVSVPTAFTSRASSTIQHGPSKKSLHVPPPFFSTYATKADQDENITPQTPKPKKSKKSYKEEEASKKQNQQELLQTLESKFNYEGRISAKLDDDKSHATADGDDDDDDYENQHRCALLTILGLPNMGKSTLLNALLSDTLAITTSRPQTTRHAILGVLTTDYCQLCFTDTPGIIKQTAYKMQEGMMDVVKSAVRDGDVFLVVTDVYSGSGSDDDDDDGEKNGENINNNKNEPMMMEDEFLGLGEDLIRQLQKSNKPIIVCVNKVDLVSNEDAKSGTIMRNTPLKAVQTIQKWRNLLPNAFAILPTCAANGPNDPGVEALRSILMANDPSVDVGGAIRNLGRPVPGMFAASSAESSSSGPPGMITNDIAKEILPIGPPLYHPDFFTDRTDRFCASELIRETLFTSLRKELPYCCEVRVESFDESKRYLDEDAGYTGKNGKSMIRIESVILVERDSQKGIVVGKGGSNIKQVGIDARKKLQEFFGVKIFLDLKVKVDKDWRNNADKLKKYGYM